MAQIMVAGGFDESANNAEVLEMLGAFTRRPTNKDLIVIESIRNLRKKASGLFLQLSTVFANLPSS